MRLLYSTKFLIGHLKSLAVSERYENTYASMAKESTRSREQIAKCINNPF